MYNVLQKIDIISLWYGHILLVILQLKPVYRTNTYTAFHMSGHKDKSKSRRARNQINKQADELNPSALNGKGHYGRAINIIMDNQLKALLDDGLEHTLLIPGRMRTRQFIKSGMYLLVSDENEVVAIIRESDPNYHKAVKMVTSQESKLNGHTIFENDDERDEYDATDPLSKIRARGYTNYTDNTTYDNNGYMINPNRVVLRNNKYNKNKEQAQEQEQDEEISSDRENELEHPVIPKTKGISKTDHRANASSQQDNDDVPLAANDIDDI